MKLVNYKLQSQMELLSEQKSMSYFKEYLISILEDDTRPYYAKADYIGLSMQELKTKIDFLSSDIKELQTFKKKLSSALNIAKELTAKVFINNGIDRIDGNIISSLTLAKETSKSNTTISILNEDEVMKLGYVKFVPDTEAISEAINDKNSLKELSQFISIENTITTTPAKIKVNTKRTNSDTTNVDEILNITNHQPQEHNIAA